MREKRTDTQDVMEIDLFKLMNVFLARWKLLLVSGVLVAALSLMYTIQFVTPMYRASVTVYVNNINANEKIEYISAGNLATAQQLVNTYTNMITSDTVLEKVVEASGLDCSAADIRGVMSTAQVGETELFKVYVSHPNPAMAAHIANAIADVAPGEIENFVEGSSTKIIDYAKVPTQRYTPSYRRSVMMGGLVGGLAAAAYIFIGYLLDVRVKDEEDLNALFDLPVLGQIPNFDETNRNKDGYGYVQSQKGEEKA